MLNKAKTSIVLVGVITIFFLTIVVVEVTINGLDASIIMATGALYIPTVSFVINWYLNHIKKYRPLISIWTSHKKVTGEQLFKEANVFNIGVICEGTPDLSKNRRTIYVELMGIEKGVSDLYINYGEHTFVLLSAKEEKIIICVDDNFFDDSLTIKVLGVIQPTGEKFYLDNVKKEINEHISYVFNNRFRKEIESFNKINSDWFSPFK